jgi:hypothetical protein
VAKDWLVNFTSGEAIAGSCIIRIPDDGSHPSIRSLTDNIAVGATQPRPVMSGSHSSSDAGKTVWSCDFSTAATVQTWDDPQSTLSCQSWVRSGIRAGALSKLIDIRDSLVSNKTAYSAIITTDGILLEMLQIFHNFIRHYFALFCLLKFVHRHEIRISDVVRGARDGTGTCAKHRS